MYIMIRYIYSLIKSLIKSTISRTTSLVTSMKIYQNLTNTIYCYISVVVTLILMRTVSLCQFTLRYFTLYKRIVNNVWKKRVCVLYITKESCAFDLFFSLKSNLNYVIKTNFFSDNSSNVRQRQLRMLKSSFTSSKIHRGRILIFCHFKSPEPNDPRFIKIPIVCSIWKTIRFVELYRARRFNCL